VIPKIGRRFSEKIMLKQQAKANHFALAFAGRHGLFVCCRHRPRSDKRATPSEAAAEGGKDQPVTSLESAFIGLSQRSVARVET